MNSQVTLKDVAKAVGLSETTVSLVVNGKATQRGIKPGTQARVSATIRQLGYQPDLINRSKALHQAVPRAAAPPDGISNVKSQIAETKPIGRQIGLVLSATSQTTTLALIPGFEQILTAAGYQLNIVVTPCNPTSTRERVGQLLQESPAGILACPSIYTVVTETVAETCRELDRRVCPVIVLWQDAAKAMLSAFRSVQNPVPIREPVPAPTPEVIEPPIATPEPAITPEPTPDPVPETPPATEPIVTPAPVIVEIPTPVITPEPVSPPEPEPVPAPTPEVIEPPIATPEPAVNA